MQGGATTAGSGYQIAAAAGSGLFLMSGATTTFDIAGTYTISDSIADDSPTSLPGGSYTAGAGAGASITKQGAGTLILSGNSTYAGGSLVNAGTLQVDGSIGDATVAGGTLGGTGSVGNIALNSGAIAPGDSPGTLNGTSLTWNGGSAFNFELGATSSTGDSDLLALSGALTKGSGSGFVFHFSDGNGAPTLNTVYTLITFTGPTNFIAGDFSYDYSGSDPSLVGTFAIVDIAPPLQALQFTATTTPVRLQSFEVD